MTVTAEFSNALQTSNDPLKDPPVFPGRTIKEGG
jgi:hypothetical protein